MHILLKEILKAVNPKEKGFKKKQITFIVFFIVSAAFWFLNSLNEFYIENINYPVRYINLPTGKQQLLSLPSQIDVKISTTGFKLLKYYLNPSVKPLVFDYQNPKDIQKAKTKGAYYILPKTKKEQLSAMLYNADILEIMPDTINLFFSLIINKKVPVKPIVNFHIKKGFVQKGPILFEPQFIEISGPKDSVDNIDTIYTNFIQLNNIDKNLKRNIALKTHQKIKYEYRRINISINVEQTTQGEIEVPISIQSNSLKIIKLIPNKINIKYKVGLSKYHDISLGDFKLTVQYNDSLQEKLVLPIILEKKPKFVFDVKYSPQFVEFIIKDK